MADSVNLYGDDYKSISMKDFKRTEVGKATPAVGPKAEYSPAMKVEQSAPAKSSPGSSLEERSKRNVEAAREQKAASKLETKLKDARERGDPSAWLEAGGFTPDDLAQHIISDGRPPVGSQQRAAQDTIAYYQRQIQEYADAHPEYKFVRSWPDGRKIVFDHQQHYFNVTGGRQGLPDLKTAFENAEARLREEYRKLRLADPEPVAPPSAKRSMSLSSKDFTRKATDMSKPTPSGLGAGEERLRRAALLMDMSPEDRKAYVERRRAEEKAETEARAQRLWEDRRSLLKR